MSTNAAAEAAQKDEPNRPIKVKDAAQMLGVTPKTIRNWVNAGKLPGYWFGYKRFIVDLDDIEPLMKFRRIAPEGDA